MNTKGIGAAITVPLTMALLSACVSQRQYDAVDTPQGRAANRRIEITVQDPGAPGA